MKVDFEPLFAKMADRAMEARGKVKAKVNTRWEICRRLLLLNWRTCKELSKASGIRLKTVKHYMWLHRDLLERRKEPRERGASGRVPHQHRLKVS